MKSFVDKEQIFLAWPSVNGKGGSWLCYLQLPACLGYLLTAFFEMCFKGYKSPPFYLSLTVFDFCLVLMCDVS